MSKKARNRTNEMTAGTIFTLFINDHSMTSELDKAGYKELGLKVLIAETQQEIDTILIKYPIEVIIMNTDFTHLDTIPMIQQLRKKTRSKDIPLIGTGVEFSVSFGKKLTKAGCDLFLEQPMPRDFFIEKIKAKIAKKVRGEHRIASNMLGKVTYLVTGDEEINHASILNLSTSGLFLVTQHQLKPGTELTLEFALTSQKNLIKVKAQVIRSAISSNQKEYIPGIGVQFTDYDEEARKMLNSFVQEQRTDLKNVEYYL